MKKFALPLLVLILIVSCEKETIVTHPDIASDKEVVKRAPGNKVDVCHGGNIINISINAVPDHRSHGDAVDMDGDGYFDGENACSEGVDCDDTNADIHPGVEEQCDDIDNNCDGNTDEGLDTGTYYTDSDGDGYGNPESEVSDCEQPDGYIAQGGDCDDDNAGANPGTSEVCGNGIDDNCDGNVDEGCCEPGSDGQTVITNNGLYWTTTNLNIDVPNSACYDNNPAYCASNGRLYSQAAGQAACAQLGDCWRIPTVQEWEALVVTYGGYYNTGAYAALIPGGSSGFNGLNTGGIYLDPFGFLSYTLYGQYLTTSPGQRVSFHPASLGYVTPSGTSSEAYGSCRCVKEME